MKKEGKIHILFSAFLVVCACCRNKVLQIETRERETGGRGKARLVSLFHFLCWNPGLEHLKTKRISKLDALLLFKGALKAAEGRGSWCHSGPWRPRAGARLSSARGSRAIANRSQTLFPFPLQLGSDLGRFQKIFICYLWNS